MKVLMLAPEFLPIRGGVGTYIVELIKNMPKDVQIHVLTPKQRNFDNASYSNDTYAKTNDEFLDKIIIHYVGDANDDFFYNFKFQLNCLKHVPSIIKRYNIDIVHSESALPDLLLNQKSVKIPIITTIHTTIRDEINSIKFSDADFSSLSRSEKTMVVFGFFLKLLENKYYAKRRQYITVSNWMKSRVVTDFKKIQHNQIEVIYNGVDSTTFNPSEKKHVGEYFQELSDIDVPKVLYLSRWAERKGIRYLLKAIPKIIEKTDVHFVFAGPSKDNNLKIPSKNCTFLGYVPQEKIPCLYASSDIFVLPSLYENFPFGLLEAMSSETAVISTSVGGIPEMINHGENGLLIKPKSTKDIVESIVYLAENDQLRKELGRRARMTIEEKFSWEKIILKTRECYKRVIENENIAC